MLNICFSQKAFSVLVQLKQVTLQPTCVLVLFVCLFLAGQLIEMFKNVEELKEELRRMTGMSNRSIENLLAIPIPDKRAEVRWNGFVFTSSFFLFSFLV